MLPSLRIRHSAWATSWLALVLVTLGAQGCGGKSAKQALDEAYKQNPKSHPVEIAKFEGKVTIDGLPPSKPKTRLFVILNDPKNLRPGNKTPKLMGGCDDSGHFRFTTYQPFDGVEVGSYVVTFVQLQAKRGFGRNRGTIFEPPDELHNLYNDPEKNEKVGQFNVVISKPGRSDWEFDLQVAGKETVENPGPYAVTKLDFR